jgi:P4 family phage/plasmid primase-like protien
MLLLRAKTQDSVALAFANLHRDSLRYTHIFGKWHQWDGKRWHVEETQLAFDFARTLARYANEEGSKGMATHAFSSGVEQIARTDRAFAVLPSIWDADNYLLNTPEGTIDLRSGGMQPHRQSDHITKMTAVAPSNNGGERFRRFLQEITCGDDELAAFLQRGLGATLSGAVEDHWLMFWIGNGRNGKNTLGDLVMYVLGDYAKQVPSETLMSQGNNERHPTELANLMGARLAVSSEVESGSHWHESRINSLTGDAMISGRFMRQDFFEFPRRHKHLVYGNHRPQVRSATVALKSRLKIVRFAADFSGREDPDLPATLRAEAPFVLAWLLDGHADWLAGGMRLGTCEAVEREAEDFFDSQPTVEMWIEERIERVPEDGRPGRSWPKASELYGDYSKWKADRGEAPLSQTRWGEEMSRLFPKVKAGGTVRYLGAALRTGI